MATLSFVDAAAKANRHGLWLAHSRDRRMSGLHFRGWLRGTAPALAGRWQGRRGFSRCARGCGVVFAFNARSGAVPLPLPLCVVLFGMDEFLRRRGL